MRPDRDPVFDRIKTETIPSAEEPVKPTGENENRLCLDVDVPEGDRDRFRTPQAVRKAWSDDQLRRFGAVDKVPQIRVRKGYKPWTSTAHLEIDPATLENPLDDNGLHLKFWVACNPKYMCQPQDLVPIYLETGINRFNLNVIVLEPTWDTNYFEVQVDYSLEEFAKILRVKPAGKDLLATIREQFREIGLRAQWLGVHDQDFPSPNGISHESGGLDQKNGSGKVRLAPYTEEELGASEGRRNTSWNLSEKLDNNRPVFQRFGSILQPGKEMMTSLEAESEYLLPTEEELQVKVISEMDSLLADKARQATYGITTMTSATKEYLDSYFDLDGLPLLRNAVVLRRREVPKKDPDGTYLFAVKGHTFTHIREPREKLRLAAQVQLAAAKLNTEEGKAALRAFLTTTMADNAFARVIEQALTSKKCEDVFERLVKEDVAVVLTLTSTRHTYQMKLKDGTVIDFSADVATASHSGKTCQVFSFEFGVGHPALTQASTATGGGAPGRSKVSELVKQTDSGPTLVRPYHVPQDLTNMTVFARSDYKQFKTLRDRLILKVFRLDLDKLTEGGNKASVLARELGMFT